METANDLIDMADVTMERPTTEGLLAIEPGKKKAYYAGEDFRVTDLARTLASRAAKITGDCYKVSTTFLRGYATVERIGKEGGSR